MILSRLKPGYSDDADVSGVSVAQLEEEAIHKHERGVAAAQMAP